jgi:hypothetical protein
VAFTTPDLEHALEFKAQRFEKGEPGPRPGRISQDELGRRNKAEIHQQIEIPETFESLRCLIKKS